LAIPSVVIGYMTIGPMLFGNFFADSIFVDGAHHHAMKELAQDFHGSLNMALHALSTLPFWLALSGVVVAWWFYLVQPAIPAALGRLLSPVVTVLENKYFLDWFNEHILAAGARLIGLGLWKGGDVALIDGAIVNGSAHTVGALASVTRLIQTGRLYWYALVMLLGIFALLTWQLWPMLSHLVGR
jgi:NADH-quinone oxidoreductase subunit L